MTLKNKTQEKCIKVKHHFFVGVAIYEIHEKAKEKRDGKDF